MTERDWKADVIRHARATGAGELPRQTADELAAHLEDIYLDAIRNGRTPAEAEQAAFTALASAVRMANSLLVIARSGVDSARSRS